MSSSQFLPSEEEAWHECIRRRELARCAVTLHKLAGEVQLTEDYPTHAPDTLAKLIAEIARILAEQIPAKVPVSELDQVGTFIGLITAHLRYVERARIAQTPWSLVQAIEELFRLVAHPKSHFIIRPTWSYNYSLIGEFWGCYRTYLASCKWFPIDELRKKVQIEDEETIYCISFPRIERMNCLLHANWGHEVGHILSKRWLDTEFGKIWSPAETKISQRIEENVRLQSPPVDPLFKERAIKSMVAQQTRATLEATQQGFVELLCDRVGVHLFGLAALAAGIEFAARFALDVSPLQAGYYPPWRFRIRKMVEFCMVDLSDTSDGEKSGSSSDPFPHSKLQPFVRWLKDAERLATSTNDVNVLESHIVTKEAYALIDAHWDTACNDVIKMLPRQLGEPYRLRRNGRFVCQLVNRIEKGVPPNEPDSQSGRIASVQDILCAAWACKLMECEREPGWEDQWILCRLALKACESSYVHSRLRDKLAQLDQL